MISAGGDDGNHPGGAPASALNESQNVESTIASSKKLIPKKPLKIASSRNRNADESVSSLAPAAPAAAIMVANENENEAIRTNTSVPTNPTSAAPKKPSWRYSQRDSLPSSLSKPQSDSIGKVIFRYPIQILSHFDPTQIKSWLEIYAPELEDQQEESLPFVAPDSAIDLINSASYDDIRSRSDSDISHKNDRDSSSAAGLEKSIPLGAVNDQQSISYISWRANANNNETIGAPISSIRDLIIVSESELTMKLLFHTCEDNFDQAISFKFLHSYSSIINSGSFNDPKEGGDRDKKIRDEDPIIKKTMLDQFHSVFKLITMNIDKERNPMDELGYLETRLALRLEVLNQYQHHILLSQKINTLRHLVSTCHAKKLRLAYKHWCKQVGKINNNKMIEDRKRWRLYALSYNSFDLQAWYHTLFYKEIYRLKGGSFWFRNASFPQYRQSYEFVKFTLSPLEEAALSHVYCSPNTSYGDVAGHMFIVQSLISDEDYKLFQLMCAEGKEITKFPRSGLPSKKPFRFSFVGGRIFLTWEGKWGNQGVDLKDVTGLLTGPSATAVLKNSLVTLGRNDSQFLSLQCEKRSVDLYLDSEADRNSLRQLLEKIIDKERGYVPQLAEFYTFNDIERFSVDEDSEVRGNENYEAEILFEWVGLYQCLGNKILNICPPDILDKIKQTSSNVEP